MRALRQLHRDAGPGDVPETGATAARERLLRPGVTVAPRRMWPTGMKDLGIDVAGKIPAELTAEPGRALGRLTDVGWGTRLRALLAEGAPDEPVTEPVVGGRDQGAGRLGLGAAPGRRADPAVPDPAALIESLGQRLAAIGRLPYLGALAYAGRRARAAPAQQRAAAAARCGTRSRCPDGVRGGAT